MSDSARRKRSYPHGTAIDADQIKDDIASDAVVGAADLGGSCQISDMFVTMCFFARLGFVQPPSCLKCAYRSSGCGRTDDDDGKQRRFGSSSCHELVPWRIDANITLHPNKLERNIVFVTCDTAKSLVNGDAYPSVRWDARNKRLLHEI